MKLIDHAAAQKAARNTELRRQDMVDQRMAPRSRAHAFKMFVTGVDECAYCGKSRKEHLR